MFLVSYPPATGGYLKINGTAKGTLKIAGFR